MIEIKNAQKEQSAEIARLIMILQEHIGGVGR